MRPLIPILLLTACRPDAVQIPETTAHASAAVRTLDARLAKMIRQPPPPGLTREEPVAVAPPEVTFAANARGLVPTITDRHLATSMELPGRLDGAMRVADVRTGTTIGVSLLGAEGVTPELANGQLVYRGGWHGGDVVLRVTEEGVEDFVTIESEPKHAEISYRVTLGDGVAGLRLVSNVLEFIDADGAPRLRVRSPYLIGARGERVDAKLVVSDCTYDEDPAPPWDRDPVPAGAEACTVIVAWSKGAVTYPAVVDPQWVGTGNMSAVRTDFAAQPLDNGRALAVGGYSGFGFLNSAEVFDGASRTWALTGAMSTQRAVPTATALGDGSVLAVGGYSGGSNPYQASTERWNGGTWGFAGSLPIAGRYRHSAARLSDGSVLVCGGSDGSAALTTCAVYSGSTWSTVAPMPNQRVDFPLIAVSGGRAIAVGGVPSYGLADLYAAGSWSSDGTLQSGRRAAAGIALSDGRVLLVGGFTGAGVALTLAEVHTPGSGIWQTAGTTATGHAPATLAMFSGAALVTGGSSQPWAELFNAGSGTWSRAPDLPRARIGHASVTLTNGEVLVVGGTVQSAVSATADVLTTRCISGGECPGGRCVDGYCCDTTCAGACDRCDVAGREGLCSVLPQGTTSTCNPFVCDGTNATCPGVCTSNTQCAAGRICFNGACIQPGLAGAACTSAAQCASGICTDQRCCDSTCGGGCESCDRPGLAGTCTRTSSGSAGECGLVLCKGAPECPGGCSADADCVSTAYCVGTTCTPKRPLAATCVVANECASNNCADGFCCDTACEGGCNRCDTPSFAGQCLFRPLGDAASCGAYVCTGSTPDCPISCSSNAGCTQDTQCEGGACLPRHALGTRCTTARQCATGLCVDGFCCNAACEGRCDACNIPGNEGSCRAEPAGASGNATCFPYVCDGVDAACPGVCRTNAQCASGQFCSLGVCVPLGGLGMACTSADQCGSGICTEGVCCDGTCTGQCESCRLAAAVGRCSAVTGAPVEGKLACPGAGSCAGTCGGVLRDRCVFPASGTACRAPSCASGVGLLESRCSDAGECPASAERACGRYRCGANACLAACSSNRDCSSGSFCSSGRCLVDAPLGSTCGDDDDCTSHHCSDGLCCNEACAGGCDRCDGSPIGICQVALAGDAPGGECAPFVCNGTSPECPEGCLADSDCLQGRFCDSNRRCRAKSGDGAACTTAVECTSGVCADGVCCDRGCNGACETCRSPDRIGTCRIVSGEPPDGRGGCGGVGVCTGRCAGEKECTFPGSETTCGIAICSQGLQVPAATCTGNGTCAAPVVEICADGCDGDRCHVLAVDEGCATGALPAAWMLAVLPVMLPRSRRRRC